jgi:DnaK suppressor protein
MNLNERFARNNEPALNASETARYKSLLLAKRDELLAAAGEAETIVLPANDTSGDVVDWARADTEAELQIRRRQSDAHLMRAIEDALARISGGRFGVCEVCKQLISKARLEAVPWTRVCRDCKEEQSPNTGERA